MRQALRAGIAAAFIFVLTLGAAPTTAHADVNDFVIESFDASYLLGRDAEGRSTLQTVERIVAVFPSFDQNRGLIRDIPASFDGHDTSVRVVSVTDENGAPRPYTTEPYGDFLSVIMAVPEGSYVHGAQTYVVEYEQRDVTRYYSDTSADEFYWDVNGTGWTQPFGSLSATLMISPELVDALDGNTACYRGEFGAEDHCELSSPEAGTFTAGATDLGAGENVSIAVGFDPGTFEAAPVPPVPPVEPPSFLERVPLLLYGGVASLLAAIVVIITTVIRGRRGAKTGRAIIAQYEPPEHTSVALAAEMIGASGKSMTATLLDLAVRRKIRLLHDEASDLYGAQLIDRSDLLPLESMTVRRLFGDRDETPADSTATLWFEPKSTKLGDAAVHLRSRAKTDTRTYGFVRKTGGKSLALIIPLILLALALPVFHSVLTGNFVLMTILLAVGINLLVWLLIGLSAAMLSLRARTPEGALLHDHLMGLKEFIRLAEADRIRMLQSASGAEVDEHRIVQVYERLLPYAVIFGFEKEWQVELSRYYRESSPEWVGGTSSTSGFMHALPLSNFGSSVSHAAVTRVSSSSGSGSGSSFSSFSGGSSGGGFSGGGGGGGGGRGI